MTAIIYFGEMVVALMLAIFLLATSTSSMGEAVALFLRRSRRFDPRRIYGPSLSVAQYRDNPTSNSSRSSGRGYRQDFLADMGLLRGRLFDCRWCRFSRSVGRLCLVFIYPLLRPS